MHNKIKISACYETLYKLSLEVVSDEDEVTKKKSKEVKTGCQFLNFEVKNMFK